MSLASRLALLIFALATVVSLLLAFELARSERGHYIKAKRDAGEMLTELFAAAVAPALDFEDTEALASALDMLSQNAEVMDAVIWPLSGSEPVARLARNGGLPLGERAAAGVQVTADYIDIVRGSRNVLERPVGMVAVRVSLARENAAFAAARGRIFWSSFVRSAVFAALLVALVRRYILKPLAAFEKAADLLARGELTKVEDRRGDEIGNLGRTFNRMGHAIAEREERISAMNARLQGLLDHMRQAIVVFDAEGKLSPERSSFAAQIFGAAAGPDTSIVDLLYAPGGASEVEREAFLVWLSEAGKASAASFEELGELAPREAILTGAGAEDRLLELEFRRAPSQAGSQRFMLLATDVTSQRQLERTAEAQERTHQKQLDAMRRLLAGGGQVFVRFLASARERLARTRRQLAGASSLSAGVAEQAFAFVHTLRAEARSFDLERIEKLVADLELDLSGVRHAPPDALLRAKAKQKLHVELDRLSGELDQAEQLFVQSSPIGRRVLEQVTVSRGDIDELFRRFGHQQDELGKLAGRLAARPFGELLSMLPGAVQRWTNDEGKKVELVISGREVLVPALLCPRLGGVLAHLLRNAIAHGIETPAERRAQNKPELGRLELACEEVESGVRVVLTDDGAGFDLAALRRAAGQHGPAGERGLELAFIAGVSTRQAPDDMAGHGVGLGAVRQELGEVGFGILVSSAPGQGSRISIESLRQGQTQVTNRQPYIEVVHE